MTGIEMMLKSFGIDPEKIKLELGQAKELIEQKIDSIDSRLESHAKAITDIRAALTRIELKLETLPTSEALALISSSPVPTSEELESEFFNGGRNNGSNHKFDA